MYLTHWGMARRPFDNSHAPELFVPVESAMLALTKLRYTAAMGLGCACVYGTSGGGKTELLRMALRDFSRSGWAVAYVANPSGSRDALFTALLHKLDGEAEAGHGPLESLENRLLQIGQAGGRVLLALDEVQAISDLGLLDDLRMLMNIEYDGVPVMSVLAAGQEGMLQRLSQAGRFDAKVALKIRLLPFNEEETEAYMLARLKISGCERGIFTRQAAGMVFSASGGVPGNINRLCELALVTAYALKKDKIKPELIRVAANELGLRNDAGTERILDEVWSDELPPREEPLAPEMDILAELSREG